jgi:hypothetical protein
VAANSEKEVKDLAIAQVQRKQRDSHFWSGLVKVKDEFLNLGHFHLNNGCNIRFWEDKWMGNYSLKELYPTLFAITRKKHISVASVFSTVPLNILFRRGLVGNNLTLWHNLVGRIAHIRLNNTYDKFVWGLHQNGIFSVKSVYLPLISDSRVRLNSTIWKLKLPLKIKIFLWYLECGVILTKDNLIRKNWRRGSSAFFCSQSNIYSLIVTLPNSYGQQYKYPSIFKGLYLFCISLTIGQVVWAVKYGSYC